METIIGIEIFPIISFIIFFVFFIALFVWVARMQKSEINFLAAMPLEDENESTKTNQQ
jgi:cbb3-type cytochrome oxidase subunit 3